MTRLINFGLGEVCDRLSILSLKILHGRAKEVDVAHFEREREALVVKLLAHGAAKWIEWYAQLAAVNAALWAAEDQLRRLRDIGPSVNNTDEIVDVAFRIQELNDQRAALVAQINSYVGDGAKEKV